MPVISVETRFIRIISLLDSEAPALVVKRGIYRLIDTAIRHFGETIRYWGKVTWAPPSIALTQISRSEVRSR